MELLKVELENLINELKEKMASKSDLSRLESEIKNAPTKGELERLQGIVAKLEVNQEGKTVKNQNKSLALEISGQKDFQDFKSGKVKSFSYSFEGSWFSKKDVGDADVGDLVHDQIMAGVNMLPDYMPVLRSFATVQTTTSDACVIDKEDAFPLQPVTTVATTFSSSATSIVLTNVTGLATNAPFNSITITDGVNTEVITILTLTAATNTITCAATTNGFAAGSTVYGSKWTVSPEGAIVPISQPQFTSQTLNVFSLAAQLKTTADKLADIPQLENMFRRIGPRELAIMEDVNFMYGSGSNGQPAGLLGAVTNINWSTMGTGTNKLDAIVKAYFTVLNDEKWTPNGVIVDTTTYQDLVLAKAVDGHYLNMTVMDGSQMTALRIPIRWMHYMPANTALVGDFSHVRIFDREQPSIEIGTNGDDFSRRRRTVVFYERVAFGCERPKAIRKVTFDSAPA